MTEEYIVAVLSINQIDPETTWYQHAMIEAARGYLLHIFSKSIIDDAVCFNLEEYFEDWIRAWIEDNGFPEIMKPNRGTHAPRSLESQEGDDCGFAQQLTIEGR